MIISPSGVEWTGLEPRRALDEHDEHEHTQRVPYHAWRCTSLLILVAFSYSLRGPPTLREESPRSEIWRSGLSRGVQSG
jgi:hypothetical protein